MVFSFLFVFFSIILVHFFPTFALQELPEGTQLDQPWIAEMYGIALAAAHLGIRHTSHPALVMPSHMAQNMLNQEGMPCYAYGSCIRHVQASSRDLHCSAHMLLGT